MPDNEQHPNEEPQPHNNTTQQPNAIHVVGRSAASEEYDKIIFYREYLDQHGVCHPDELVTLRKDAEIEKKELAAIYGDHHLDSYVDDQGVFHGYW
jgi:2-hydroxychromene-2-carboxylate isomerase